MAAYFNELFASGKGTFELVVVCIYIGIVAACAVAIYQRRLMGDYIRALIGAGALDREHAKTLAELGYEKRLPVKRALRGAGLFAGTVYEASEEVEFDREDHALPVYRESFDAEKARFYIPEPLKYRAEVRFEKKGSHIMALIAGAILFAVIVVLMLIYKERIVSLVSEWLGLEI